MEERADRPGGPRSALARQTWAWNMLWGREVDLPDGLLFQPGLGHLFRDLCSGS